MSYVLDAQKMRREYWTSHASESIGGHHHAYYGLECDGHHAYVTKYCTDLTPATCTWYARKHKHGPPPAPVISVL